MLHPFTNAARRARRLTEESALHFNFSYCSLAFFVSIVVRRGFITPIEKPSERQPRKVFVSPVNSGPGQSRWVSEMLIWYRKSLSVYSVPLLSIFLVSLLVFILFSVVCCLRYVVSVNEFSVPFCSVMF